MALFHTTVVDNQIKALDTIGTASGSIATFDTDRAERLVNLEVAITATGGGGTPVSPIAINGWSDCLLALTDNTDIQYFSGLLKGTYAFVDLGSLSWGGLSRDRWNTTDLIGTIKTPSTNSRVANIICTTLVSQSADNVYLQNEGISVQTTGDTTIYSTALIGKTSAEVQTALTGVYLIYELATATTPTINKTNLDMLLSAFSVNGTTETIPFGQTIYGGRLNVGSGVLTVTHKAKTFNDLAWSYNSTYNFFNVQISDCDTGFSEDDIKTSVFESIYGRTNANMADAPNNTINHYGITIKIKCSDYTDPNAFKTAFASEPIMYKLATPIEIQLDSKQIQTIANSVNNIYADTGDIIDLKFVLSVGQAIS